MCQCVGIFLVILIQIYSFVEITPFSYLWRGGNILTTPQI